MLLTEWDQEKVLEQERRDSIRQGIKQGISRTNQRVATDMLRDKKPLDEIIKYSQLAEDSIRQIAKSLGLTVI